MNRITVSAGIILITLGVGLAVVGITIIGLIDHTLSIVYIIGGFLLLVFGAAILALDLRVKRSKEKQLNKLR
jgi:hypothetical protein